MRFVTAMVAGACLVLSGCAGDDPAAAPPDSAGEAAVLVNPVIETDFADPDVVVTADGLVAYATGVPGSSAIQVAESGDDPDTWSDPADALPERPDWQALQEGLTWAPDVMERDGTWWMYYVARDSASGHQCLSRAAGQAPKGPFVDDSDKPFLCQHDLGGSIDPEVFADDDGSLWLYWKNDGNAIGVDTTIWVQRLDDDGVTLLGKPQDTGLRQTHAWQGALVEAPAVIRRGGTYVMFYSANDYGSADYAMGYAVASSPQGPFVDQSPEPWVSSTPQAAGLGGQAVLTLGEDTWLAYHAWDPDKVGYAAGGERSMWLDRIRWDGDVPVLEGPSVTPLAVPSG